MGDNIKNLPLTNVQRAYLVGRTSSFELGGCSTHVYYEFFNDLDIAKFDETMNNIIAEQEMLRAIITKDGEELILNDVPEYKSQVYDWTDKTQEEIDELILKQREKYSHEVMESDKWPLFKFEFALLPSGSNYMFFSSDLLVMDAGSFTVLGKELNRHYYNLGEIDVNRGTFEDYLNKIANSKKKKKYNIDKAFWENILDSIPQAPSIPMKETDITSSNNTFKRKQFFIDESTWSKTKEKFNTLNISATVGVLAAYAEILGFWSNQDEFTLNLPMTNAIKRKADMIDVMGDFTEELLLPLVNNKNFNDFDSYAKYVNSEFLKYFKHNSFDGLEVMAAMRNKTNNNVKMPIVYTGMISDKGEFDNLDFFGKMAYGVSQTPQVTLDCQVFETHGELKVVWDYIENMFDITEIDTMFNQFIKLISSIGSDSYEDIINVPEYQKKKLDKYNDTYKKYEETTLLNLLEKNLHTQGEEIAVTDSEGSITYSELDELSNYVAKMLVNKGIKQGSKIAVLGNRDKETIANILGIIKCGCIYVPINPQYPETRRKYIQENSSCIDILDSTLMTYEKEKEFDLVNVKPSDDAYIIYTSGSTGTPKGVVISHDSVCNTIQDINERFNVTNKDKFLCVSSFGFDLSVYDIFGSLIAGGELVIAKDNKNIKNLSEIIENKHITVWNSVPSIMDLVVDNLESNYTNNTLRLVLLSGDWIPTDLPTRIFNKFTIARTISLGGATEGSIWSIYFDTKDLKENITSIPYGYPLGNQQMYILDEDMNLVPYEVEGEIYIGGRGVARRYENNIEKTESSFIHHEKLGYIYKTGDYGIMKREGYMEFRGRRDEQVKIHGYRVELGEIATAVQKLQGIQKAIVDINKTSDILGYIVPDILDHDIDVYDKFDYSEKIHEYEEKISVGINSENLEKLEAYLEHISTYYMKKFFKTYGDFTSQSDTMNLDEFIDKNNIELKFKGLLELWLNELIEDKIVSYDNGVYTLLEDYIYEDEDDLWNTLYSMEGSSYIQSISTYLQNSCNNHIELFRGEIVPVSLLYHDAKDDVAKNIYGSNPISKYVNSIAQKAILDIVNHYNKKDTFKILEVGAGIAGTTAEIFKDLNNLNVKYDYTDISDFFLNKANDRFSEYNFLDYKILDINKDFQEQGYSYATYDMIIAANVLHDSSNIDKTLQDIKKILKPNGFLVMLETTQNLRSQMTSFGFLEGLTPRFDEENKIKKPLLNENEWKDILLKNNMQDIEYYVTNKKLKKAIWQNVFIARNKTNIKPLSEENIIKELKTTFPDYMIPTKIFVIDKLPLSVNGKVNKKALPKLQSNVRKNVYCPPTNELEEKLVNLWKESLNIDKVGIKDNFFELGGDSLKAIKIVTMAEKEGIKIELADLYKYNTIEDIAKVVSLIEDDTILDEISDIDTSLNEDDLNSILEFL